MRKLFIDSGINYLDDMSDCIMKLFHYYVTEILASSSTNLAKGNPTTAK